VSYTVSDGRGGSARGTVTVYVQDDAPLKAPIARDDFVSYEELPTDGSAVRVKVLDNDEDPDGSINELTVTTSESGVTVEGSDVLIPVTDSKRLVVYTITDRDGLTNSAVVTVPGRDTTAPFLNTAGLPIEMDAGTSRTINLSDYVVTRSGRTPRLVDDSSPVAQTGLDSVVADSSTQLTLTANASFGGNSAFLIQVADGDASDSGTLTASLSLPVRIKATQNQPPTFAPTAIRVEAGGAAVTQDLRLGVRDPEGTDVSTFTYAMGSAPATISASLSGTVLTVSAPENAPAGSAGAIAVSVTDEQGNTVNGSIPVEVVGTTKPRIQLPAYNVKAKVGETVSVDVASEATNPFPDTPISIEGTAISLGDATTSTSGTVVTITPKSAGTISVAYRVNDKLKDPSRVVQGTITVQVIGPPDAPTAVVARAKGPTGATVSFHAPAPNGERITEYRIFSGGSQVATCTETVCEVNGLTTGRSYTFTVKAVNASGESEGATSNSVTPSGVPDRPGGPTVTASDGTLTVRWDAPNDNGSPITSYTVNATTAGSAATTCTTSVERTCIIKGLKNGQPYIVTVVATNANGNSQASPGVTGTPKATIQPPDKPVISSAEVKQVGQIMFLDLYWILGKSGSSGWGTTTIRVGDKPVTSAGGETSRRVPVTPGATVNVTVTVTNLQGESATSDARTVTIPALAVVEDLKTTPLPPDPPGVGPNPDNEFGVIRISNARLKEGNGYKASDLELYHAESAAACKTSGSLIPMNNGTRGDFDIHSDPPFAPGSTRTYYFCQRGKRGPNDYVWSDVVASSGTVGTGQRSRDDDDNSPIPPFTIQATAGADTASATWTNPSGVTIARTKVSIEGFDGPPNVDVSGPLDYWSARNLEPGHEYTLVVELTGRAGQHRTVKTTFKTAELNANIDASFEGATTCPNGQPCGSMTLYATRASQFQPGVTVVCKVKTGRPASITEFRFSRDNPRITGILTEATTAAELLANHPVVECRAE